MNKFILTTVLFITPFLGYAAISQEETKNKMVADLDSIKSIFAVMYAPAEWKREYTNWDLDEQINRAKITVEGADGVTLKDFQRTLLGFFNSTKDYHVGVGFYSTEAAFLPFRVHSTNGKYYVAWVHKSDSTILMERDGEEDDDEDRFIGAKKSFVPALGEAVWNVSEDNPFHAYIYLDSDGKRIGYVRIPHYGAGSHSAEKFAEIIKTFEEQTDALIVDQVSNPGGNFFYMYALASI